MHPEEQAQTKVCQETMGRDRAPGRCLGSICMAWRWREDDVSGDRQSKVWGYCGKAGRP